MGRGCLLFVAVLGLASLALAADGVSTIKIEYPAEGSLFPPDIASPTFLWHDTSDATVWRVDVTFADGMKPLQFSARGELLQLDELDTSYEGHVIPKLTPEQASMHTWKPEPDAWATIKKHSVANAATVKFSGFRDQKTMEPVSQAQVTLQTSTDPVGAPVFYRDVPLMPVPTERGVIKPLPQSAIPLIKWRLRWINEPESKVMMSGLPTCVNCHSFSRDGKTLGIDVDGPANDKGLYALVAVQKETSIRNEDVIHWNSFRETPATRRFGFMSQVSPDGKYVITSIENPGGGRSRGLDDRFYNAGYNDYAFGQVFYPTRGILAWYSRETGKLKALPGADDPRFVQASAFWSPDGKYLVFVRAEARDPYTVGQKNSLYANSPDETSIQYDLYRIPFNDGLGGKPERVVGASENGKSNSFPKVSPDGKWIVWVQARNGLLMRPDSQLYIVPAEGGTPRRLNANAAPMNSWHSWSPNGRWLVFSSKRFSGFTRMYLTHIDDQGNDSPAILIEHSTAGNRAVNIPEFLNIQPDGMQKMDSPAIESYRLFDIALDKAKKNNYAEAIPEWKKVIELSPEEGMAYFNLGVALVATGDLDGAISHLQKAAELRPEDDQVFNNLAVAYVKAGKVDLATVNFKKALEINPQDARAQSNFGALLLQNGKPEEAIPHLKMAVQLEPDNVDALNNLALALLRTGKADEAIPYLEKALAADPTSGALQYALAGALMRLGRLEESIPHFEKALAADPKSVEIQYNLGRVLVSTGKFQQAIPHLEAASVVKEAVVQATLALCYGEVGRYADASRTGREAMDLAVKQNNQPLAAALNAKITFWDSKTNTSHN
jgi:tetratricopeptide (TPR) repeat protein